MALGYEGGRVNNLRNPQKYRRSLFTIRRIKRMRQILPTLIIIALQLRRLQREARGPNHVAGFEHEGHRIFDTMHLTQIRVTCFVEGFRIGPVAAHAIV